MTSIALQVRPADCDSLGHVNNAVYVSQIHFALARHLAGQDARHEGAPNAEPVWLLDGLAIEYRLAATYQDRLYARLWLAERDGLRPVLGCEFFRPGTDGEDQVIARSRSDWRLVDRASGETRSLDEAVLDTFPTGGGTLPRKFAAPADSPDFRRYQWEHKVMRTELDPSGLAHSQAVYNWIEESIFEASAEAGWTVERWLDQGLMVFQMRHDTQFHQWPGAGDRLQIVSRLAEVRRRRGTWINDIFRRADRRLLIRNYSTGVFLNLDGRSAAPPQEMMDDIQQAR